MAFIKKKVVDIDGEKVEISQLSGLDRFDYLDFVTDLPKPQKPVHPGDSATDEQLQQYYEEADKIMHQFSKLTFQAQSRLVAYGYRNQVESIDERHHQVMATMTPEQVYRLNDEIAAFSGMLPAETDDAQPAEQEPEVLTDPKA